MEKNASRNQLYVKPRRFTPAATSRSILFGLSRISWTSRPRSRRSNPGAIIRCQDMWRIRENRCSGQTTRFGLGDRIYKRHKQPFLWHPAGGGRTLGPSRFLGLVGKLLL